MPPNEKTAVRIILLDIEGTTTPVDFVYRMLFPFASRKFESFLRQHFHDADVHAQIAALKEQHEADRKSGLAPPALLANSEEAEITSLAAYGRWLIERDSKCTPLKALEGLIWQEGYANGELRGEVYPDVPPAFERWRRQGRDLCMYSSGSVLAQKLLFRTTASGDLTRFLRDFFDTQIGVKTDVESYKKIAAALDTREVACVFLSDSVKELDAARSAGMQTALCLRSSHRVSSAEAHPSIHTFDEVFP